MILINWLSESSAGHAVKRYRNGCFNPPMLISTFSNELGFLLKMDPQLPSCIFEAVHCVQEKLSKNILWKSYGRKEVSITVYINIKSYTLVCWVCCELPTLSPLGLLQLPLW